MFDINESEFREKVTDLRIRWAAIWGDKKPLQETKEREAIRLKPLPMSDRLNKMYLKIERRFLQLSQPEVREILLNATIESTESDDRSPDSFRSLSDDLSLIDPLLGKYTRKFIAKAGTNRSKMDLHLLARFC